MNRYSQDSAPGDRYDCVPRALKCAFDLTHAEAVEWCALYGRKHRDGMYVTQTLRMLEYFGAALIVRGGKDVAATGGALRAFNASPRSQWRTLGAFIKAHPKGRYFVRVTQHAVAVIDGVLHDWEGGEKKLRRRVRHVWQVN